MLDTVSLDFIDEFTPYTITISLPRRRLLVAEVEYCAAARSERLAELA
jgi:hypothetical protein